MASPGKQPPAEEVRSTAAQIAAAAAAVAAGQIVAFPTETYYGLGVDPQNPSALRSLSQLKGRNAARKPLLLLADSIDQLATWVDDFPQGFDRLAAHFWPGPLTLVLPAKRDLPAPLRGPGGGVAIRVCAHPLARTLIRACGTAITGTSANRTGQPASDHAAAVRAAFGKQVPVVVDGGRPSGGLPSTLLDLCGPRPRLLRRGAVSEEALRALVGLL